MRVTSHIIATLLQTLLYLEGTYGQVGSQGLLC